MDVSGRKGELHDNGDVEESMQCVSHQSLTWGQYSLDECLEKKVRALVVTSELRAVEAAIKALCDRTQSANSATSASNAYQDSLGQHGTCPVQGILDAPVRNSIGTFLYGELRMVRIEADGGLGHTVGRSQLPMVSLGLIDLFDTLS